MNLIKGMTKQEYNKYYRINNKEKIKIYNKNYRKSHNEVILIYRQTHKKEHLNHSKNYYLNHKDKSKQWQKDYYEKNKEYILERNKIYRQNHKKELESIYKKYAEDHKEEIKQYMKEYRKTEQWKLRDANHHDKRKRNLNSNLLIENIIDEKSERHHIDDDNIVFIPEDLHKLYPGYHITEHRFMCNQIAEQLYNIKLL